MTELALISSGSFLVGLLIGCLVSRGQSGVKYKEALETERREREKERADLSAELNESLSRIRQNLSQTMESYEHALRVVSDKLPVPDMSRALEGGAPLGIDYKDVAGQAGELFPDEMINERLINEERRQVPDFEPRDDAPPSDGESVQNQDDASETRREA